MLLRAFAALIMAIGLMAGSTSMALAQGNDPARAATGGAQTLEDILARQRGETVDYTFRREDTGLPEGAAPNSDQLGTLGGVSDPEFLRAMRYNTAELTSQVKSASGNTVMQDGGMWWLEMRRGPLPKYGGYMMGAMVVVLALFFLLRGQIKIEGGRAGQTILRFSLLERVAHWSMAIPFVLLGVTGIVMLIGRLYLIDIIGKPAFSTIAVGGKFIHNYIAWIFMFGLVLSFFLWAWKNLPDRYDIPWLLKGGGMFTKGSHPSSNKFNAGEKIIFWAVMGMGLLISITGLALLFPYKIQIIGDINQMANTLGLPQLLGFGELQTVLAAQEEMQLAQLWHAGIGFVFMTIILAHIYLGSVGMEGALDSMTKGTVDVQWAKEHHDIWYDEMSKTSAKAGEQATKNTQT
ncbi:MAG: formate dehydrogenase subunit gamma [Rhodobacteraceae bacterium]|nr:formate dehydrogenase subunit gamma [Paracoccaceae bacterium]